MGDLGPEMRVLRWGSCVGGLGWGPQVEGVTWKGGRGGGAEIRKTFQTLL